MKLKPFETYVGNDPCINYIGIRADEKRVGYISHKPNIKPVYPFRDDGIDYNGVVRILEGSGLGMPPYAAWGRTRSGCFFCFFQQKIRVGATKGALSRASLKRQSPPKAEPGERQRLQLV